MVKAAKPALLGRVFVYVLEGDTSMALSFDEIRWMRRLSAGEEELYLAKKREEEDEMNQRPNIYFAGSITSGRDDQPIYAEIIRLLSSYGRVLTQHVGNARLTALGEQDHTQCAIYDRNMRWLAESGVMVAEATIPSFGVGYEVAKAEGLSMPILLLYRGSPDRRLTAMADKSVSPRSALSSVCGT